MSASPLLWVEAGQTALLEAVQSGQPGGKRMRPVIYGYMRLGGNGDEDGESRVAGDELAHHADREGFFLERMFMEHPYLSSWVDPGHS